MPRDIEGEEKDERDVHDNSTDTLRMRKNVENLCVIRGKPHWGGRKLWRMVFHNTHTCV